jgi:hypothetical protein
MKKKWMSMLVHYANKKREDTIFIALGQRQDEEKILVMLLVLVFWFGKTHRI